MGRALDCAARSTDPLAQLSRVERRKRYGGIPVWLIGPVAAYDAPDAVTRIGITSNDSENLRRSVVQHLRVFCCSPPARARLRSCQ